MMHIDPLTPQEQEECPHRILDVAIDDSNPSEPWKLVAQCMECGKDLSHVDHATLILAAAVPYERTIVELYTRLEWHHPTADEAFRWMVAEMGEIAEAMNMQDPHWVRNNPTKTGVTKSPAEILEEVGDLLLMAMVLSMRLGGDPFTALELKYLGKIVEAHNAAYQT